MAPNRNDSAKANREDDYAERCRAKGVAWLSPEYFADYQQHWEAKPNHGHGGKRAGAGEPKKEAKPEGDDSSESLCTYWDVTAWYSRVGEDPRAWLEIIKPHFKSGGWQTEKTPTTDALHFQGRFATRQRHRPGSKAIAQIANGDVHSLELESTAPKCFCRCQFLTIPSLLYNPWQSPLPLLDAVRGKWNPEC